ncbi:transcriptional regulator, AraC family [Pseudomonas delhiensis]|uniref:Transcriptional regulator, AraC family n=1 Tax=Pseudomonas delhiensis TaxID=366289 RepID=A0A239MRK9_9PSED|nr:helix-turn-helix domain-containing protein [Pseudomonas delhiensis]SDL03872.1 transcriptional regulator, AraC family [Pseudomonas delhiensis]SNT45376.1 transcriptional regulator, AraC family [Pseudomonas delhiensis]
MSSIPNYDLYGEAPQPVWHESLHVESISQRSGAHNWEIAPHRHDGQLQILYLQQGAGEVLLESQWVAAQAPCVIYIPAQMVHGFHWAGQVDGHVVTALQPPLESAAAVLSPALLPQLQKPWVIPLPHWETGGDPLLPLCLALHQEYHERAREHVACSMSLLLALVIHIFRCAAEADHPAPPQGRRSQQVRAFRELVEAHFRRHRPVHDYADELGVTMATLGRLCQEQLGMTPMAVINARLVLEAKRELAHSRQSVKAIAHDLGFSDVGYFSRFFRKHTRLSPSEFRSQGAG